MPEIKGTLFSSVVICSYRVAINGISITSNILTDIVYANNTFGAVGGNGTIITSPDGNKWTVRSSGTANNLYRIVHANNTFVVVGQGGTIIQSGACAIALSSNSKTINYSGSSGSIRVTTNGSNCSWAATSYNLDWLTITSGASDTGKSGNMVYRVVANTSPAARTGHITVGDQTFTVTQTGGTPKISAPSSLSIGNVKKDVASDTKTITVKNSGTANLEISDVTITGTNSSEFTYEKTGCDSVAPKGSCTISVTLTATSYGSRSATLSITSNGATKPTTVKLTGTAVPPKISVPTSLSTLIQ